MTQYLKERYNTYTQDNKKFTKFYKKKFPILYYLLPVIQIVSLMAMLYYSKVLNVDYAMVYQSTLDLELSNIDRSLLDAYKKHSNFFWISCGFYFGSVSITFVIALYVIYKANSPIDNRLLQVAKHGAKVAGAIAVGSVGYSHAPIEPNAISNFVHTKTLLGRGYDYEIGSLTGKLKGDVISNGLGRKTMLEAVDKYAPDSKILDSIALNNIVADGDYSKKLREQLNFAESRVIGLLLVDLNTSISSTERANLTNVEVANKEGKNLIFDDPEPFRDEDEEEKQEPTSYPNLKKDQDLMDAERRGVRKSQKKVRFTNSKS